MADTLHSSSHSVYSFRPVQPVDLPRICSFPRSAQELYFMFPKGTYPLTPAQLQAAIDQRRASTVMLKEGSVVGFANMYQCEPGERIVIGNFIIDPSLRRQGCGTALLGEMTRQGFEEQNARTVELSCFNLNTGALLLYMQFGYTPVSLEARVNYSGEPIVSIHFQLTRLAWLEKLASQSADSQ